MTERASMKLTRTGVARVRAGHLWIYKSEARSIEGAYENGAVVDVLDEGRNLLGRGFINDRSQILVRLWTHEDEMPGEELLLRRLDEAIAYRRSLRVDAQLGRLVNAEGDRMPGLVVDRYRDTIVVQIQSLGIEPLRDGLFRGLSERFPGCALFERSDTRAREIEGLTPRIGFWGEARSTEVTLKTREGLELCIDVASGQKTGAYLDQIENQAAFAKLCAGRSVLDAFCHEGGFGLSALLAKASRAVLLDLSEPALGRARGNAKRNGLEAEILKANAFDALRSFDRDGVRFDAIVLDPPAFTKSKAQLSDAYRGYKEINLRALRLVAKDGLLFTSSCSYHVSREMFREMLLAAALDSGRVVRIVEERGAGPDHPELATMPETRYLKCILAHVA